MNIKDLHICKSPSQAGSSETEVCVCPPEYECVDVCPEGGFSVSTLISWQHFPRSTSSRSECFESDDATPKSVTQTPTEVTVEKEEESLPVSSTEYPITKSFAQLNALHYLEVRHVFELLNFLMSHLICNEPEDPVEFLVDLLQRCLKYRDAFGEPPQLFTHSHVKSLYNAFDPFERGYITLDQYKEAMRSLGLENNITPYNQEPPLNDEDCVDQNEFILEAERCLTENLKQMLRIPKNWEENRRLWKRRMRKRKPLVVKKESDIVVPVQEEQEKRDSTGSQCTVLPADWKCPNKEPGVRNEPEQLFLY